jgi:signal transduction histidine kinase
MTVMPPPARDLETLLELVIHEFRTPASVFGGYSRMLLAEQLGPLTGPQRNAIEQIQKSSSDIAHFIQQLDELLKFERGAIRTAEDTVDLDDVVDEAVAKAEEGRDRGITIERQRGDGPLVVTADRRRLSASVAALLHAVLREQGTPVPVVVRTGRITIAGRPMAALAIGAGDTARIVLESHSPEARLNEGRGGLGFVIPIARRLVERHHGRIWSSAPDVLNKGNERLIGGIAFAIPLKETRS